MVNEKSNLDKDFKGQRHDETVIIILQKHWFVVAWPLAKGALLILIALVLPSIGKIGYYIFNSGVIGFLYFAWLVFWGSYLAYEYLNWHKDRFIITDQRIINIDQKSLFSRKVSEVELERVQDIYHEIVGTFATTMDYGVIVIQSAGSSVRLEDIAKPAEMQDMIVRLVKEATKNPPVTAEELVDFIKDHRT
ncbi:PH domain-containing protein [Patescibacteria group bacterium]|nr:PH domain-containing protein [Patescibacteria group bacterium]